MHSIDRTSAKEMVGPGWAGLIDVLYTAMPENVVVYTVKEKFGCLRVYADGGGQDLEQLIEDLEMTSNRICECCGKIGHRRSVSGWLTTLCEQHHQERLVRIPISTGRLPGPTAVDQTATGPTDEAG